jgi:hypothetical protein
LVFPLLFLVISAYKDPVEIHHVRKFLDKVITGFFVFIFAILWFCSTKYYVKSKDYNIMIYDIYGKESNPNGIRTKFNTQDVAYSYVKEYQKLFPHMEFFIQSHIPEIKRKTIFSMILKKDHR